jgi:Kef-type K+ transport system membrane component KefB
VFVVVGIAVFAGLPLFTRRVFSRYGSRTSELEAKFLLFALFAMGGLSVWAGSEAVLPAYIIGMVLAGVVGTDHALTRRLRTMTFGLLTPFYFIRAGSFVSVPALVAAPLVFVALFFAKTVSKMSGLLPTVRAFNFARRENMYYTLMMSTGLTFGTISSLFGLNHGIITQVQYSHLVATVIGTAVVPTLVANAFFLPGHLLPRGEQEHRQARGAVELRPAASVE